MSIDDALTLPDEMDASLDASIRRIHLVARLANEFRTHGQPERAIQLERRGVPILGGIDETKFSASVQVELLRAFLSLRRDSAALALARKLSQRDSTRFVITYAVGVAFARGGDTPSAEREMHRLEAIGRENAPYAAGTDLTEGARIAAALGRNNEAMALGSRAIAQGDGYGFRRYAHIAPEFALLRKNPEFQRLVKPRDD